MPAPKNRQIDWDGERDVYVTGDESFAQMARRLGVTKSAVEKHASNREANGGRTWGEWREEFRAAVSGKSTKIAERIRVEATATVAMRHAQMLADLASDAKEHIKNALEECEPKDKVKLALAIIMAERRVHGLDKSPVQLEVTGKNGEPLQHDLTIDFDNDADARDLASRTLEAIFGKTPKQDGASPSS